MPDPTATDVTSADNTAGDSTSTLYRAAIGGVNTDYYLPIFTHFESTDRVGMRWNWAASLCTLNWFAFRRLWGAALVYSGAVVAIALMIFGIGRLVLQFSQTIELALLLTFALVAFAVPGLFGNAVFYADCRKRMGTALTASATLDDACNRLQRSTASRARLAWLALANAAIVGAVVSGYFSFPTGAGFPFGAEAPVAARNVVSGPALDASPAPPTPPAPVVPVLPTSNPATPTNPAGPAEPATIAAPAQVQALPAPEPVAATPVPSAPEPQAAASPPVATSVPPAAVIEPTPALAASVPKKAAATKAPTAKAPPKVATEKAASKVPAKTSKAKDDDAPYYINVGLFADDNNARNARVKLTDAGFAAFTQELKTSKGVLTRVRVGPFGSETAAESAQAKIRAMGLEALIIQP